MSAQAMTWARGKAMTSGAQLVLFSLCDHADPHGVTYVGQGTLAAECRCSETHVRRSLALLERCGLVARIRRNNARGWRTSDYTVVAPLLADRGEMVAAGVECRAPKCSHGRDLPIEVFELARVGLRLSTLPSSERGRGASLPANKPTPSDQPAPANRADESRQPTSLHGEQFVELSDEVHQGSHPSHQLLATDEGARADSSLADDSAPPSQLAASRDGGGDQDQSGGNGTSADVPDDGSGETSELWLEAHERIGAVIARRTAGERITQPGLEGASFGEVSEARP